ncbi:MAG TPA: family 20 glycosylhydrolase [Terracidiphilus sp.]
MTGLMTGVSLCAQESTGGAEGTGVEKLHLMPLPRSVQMGQGELALGSSFKAAIVGDHDARLNVAFDRFLTRLDRQCGGISRAQHDAAQDAKPVLTLKVAGPGGAIQGVDEDESYKLTVTASEAELSAATDVGAMHGMETLLQLADMRGEGCRLPALTLDDAPRFRWRGLHLDVSRHFETMEVIERTLDAMAVAKLNVFHWHLSDDQGFRAESKKFPKFTEVASDGLFYTQDQMREIVAYARARGIRVVPEFDIPGHTSSWLVAYPELGAEEIKSMPIGFGIPQAELDPSNEKTFKFLDEFIGEMAGIFPDAYFHIGGDETKGKGWLENPRIAEFMKKKGFDTPEKLQAYFNQRLLPILKKHGKTMMGWDEILTPELPKDIMVQSWRGDASLAAGAQQGYVGILSAPYYLDAQKTSEMMFLADPIPSDTKLTAEQQKLIWGGEICMWGEQIHPETVDSRVWPRSLAIAERFWSPQADRDVADMYRRLRIASLQLEDVGLTHISGPRKLRRNLAGSMHPEALEVMASVVEPATFHDRYQAQHTDRLTSLDRMIDAVVPDPPARQEIARQVDALLKGDRAAAMELRRRFESWQEAAPRIQARSAESARLSDVADRARQLGEFGRMGLEALAFIQVRTAAPAGWVDAQKAAIEEAKKPSGMLRFVFLPEMQKLVQGAATCDAGGCGVAAAAAH